MKQLPIISTMALAAILAVSCKQNSNENAQVTTLDSADVVSLSREELEATLMAQDSLLNLVNDISADMVQLKSIEMIVSSPSGLNGETASQKQQILNDMAAVKQTLAERRQRLATLEEKLKQNSQQNAMLLKTIESLKAQIEQNEATIQSLNQQLAEANVKIQNLNVAVDSLNTSVATEKAGKEKALAEASNLTNELNTCYYAIGSKSELESHNIIQTGFLRKTKIMQGDYQMNYFTAIDKRTATKLPLYNKKAKVLTNQPKDSYRLVDDSNGMKVLEITNPTRFWEGSNFLVVQIN